MKKVVILFALLLTLSFVSAIPIPFDISPDNSSIWFSRILDTPCPFELTLRNSFFELTSIWMGYLPTRLPGANRWPAPGARLSAFCHCRGQNLSGAITRMYYISLRKLNHPSFCRPPAGIKTFYSHAIFFIAWLPRFFPGSVVLFYSSHFFRHTAPIFPTM